ncbi:MAG: polysaccharide deacetylase family protein [Actinobacteria bacterium]|nr:polysaccharide deacetylase family protein [Actinomycetota bacterium]
MWTGVGRIGRSRRHGRRLVLAAVLLAGAVAAACDPPAIPDPGRTVGALGGPPSQVALTFDDGPNPQWTPQVLDILDRYGVSGTFFVTGEQVARHPDLARAIVQRGHSIANHTWNHPTLTRISGRAMVDQLAGTSNVIRDTTGYIVSYARPPYGSTNAGVNNTIASLGMRPALWSVDTRDWSRPGVGAIVRSALSARPDSVVLFHDGGGDRSQTVAALPAIIEGFRARGMDLTRVCDSRPGVGPR